MDNETQSAVPFASLAITKVADSTGELLNPGTTSDTELTLSGTGVNSAVVFIKDSDVIVGSASVTTNGTW